VSDKTLDIFLARASALRATREFFWQRGYVEIDTPVLSPALIPEHTIKAFSTVHYSHSGTARPLYLIPSPEVWMKRLLAMGSGNIFQISRCFRNGEPPTGMHHPEFTMLEWYAVGKDFHDNIPRQEEYGEHLRRTLRTAPTVTVRGVRVDLRPPWRRMSMREAFLDLADVDLAGLSEIGALREAVRSAGMTPAVSDDWESLFHRLFLEKVEPRLPLDRPLFLTDYPAGVSTLARTAADNIFAERWELFIGGIEIANCYTEERDPRRLREFFQKGGEAGSGTSQHAPADRELETVMAAGLPVCSGNALGLDRLLMVLLQRSTIKDVLPFAWCRDE
jgi:lysyl-tRNA synthetase class 2